MPLLRSPQFSMNPKGIGPFFYCQIRPPHIISFFSSGKIISDAVKGCKEKTYGPQQGAAACFLPKKRTEGNKNRFPAGKEGKKDQEENRKRMVGYAYTQPFGPLTHGPPLPGNRRRGLLTLRAELGVNDVYGFVVRF